MAKKTTTKPTKKTPSDSIKFISPTPCRVSACDTVDRPVRGDLEITPRQKAMIERMKTKMNKPK